MILQNARFSENMGIKTINHDIYFYNYEDVKDNLQIA